MLPSQIIVALASAFLGWVMVRLGVGAALVGIHLVMEGNRWAVLLAFPAAASMTLAVFAVSNAAQGLSGRRPGG